MLYGSRKAGRVWVEHLAGLLRWLGLNISIAAKQLFEVHMDGVKVAGDEPEIRCVVGALKVNLKLKHAHICPFGETVTYTHLRQRRFTAQGCFVKANLVYVERCAKVLGLSELKMLVRRRWCAATGMARTPRRASRTWIPRGRSSIDSVSLRCFM